MQSIAGQNVELRRRLVIEDASISVHCDKVKALKQQFHHTIRCLSRPENGTCLTQATGLLEANFRLCEEWQGMGITPGTDFVDWLLEKNHLVEVVAPKAGALALYFDDGGEWKHAGVVIGMERLVSKWGTHGVYDHGFAEVPANYGNTIRFFEMPQADATAKRFFDYGCECLKARPEEIERLRDLIGMAVPIIGAP